MLKSLRDDTEETEQSDKSFTVNYKNSNLDFIYLKTTKKGLGHPHFSLCFSLPTPPVFPFVTVAIHDRYNINLPSFNCG